MSGWLPPRTAVEHLLQRVVVVDVQAADLGARIRFWYSRDQVGERLRLGAGVALPDLRWTCRTADPPLLGPAGRQAQREPSAQRDPGAQPALSDLDADLGVRSLTLSAIVERLARTGHAVSDDISFARLGVRVRQRVEQSTTRAAIPCAAVVILRLGGPLLSACCSKLVTMEHYPSCDQGCVHRRRQHRVHPERRHRPVRLPRAQRRPASWRCTTSARSGSAHAERLARRIAAQTGAGATVTASLDRRAALDGADYVINEIQVGGYAATRLDFDIPRRYGVRQTIADTLGIGGIFRGLRTIPVVVGVGRGHAPSCARTPTC